MLNSYLSVKTKDQTILITKKMCSKKKIQKLKKKKKLELNPYVVWQEFTTAILYTSALNAL